MTYNAGSFKEIVMIDTPLKKLSLILGSVWLIYTTVMTVRAVLFQVPIPGGSHLVEWLIGALVPVAILWAITGVLKPVISWFMKKGS